MSDRSSHAYRIQSSLVWTLVLVLAGTSGTACAADRIRPYSENAFFWQYKGEPVLLVGGSWMDNLFNHPEGLEEHLDRIAAGGGNYVRNTMSDRNPENRYAFARREDGLYDLNEWDTEYWNRVDSFLRMCHERDIIVQIEVWDPWDLFASEAPLGYGPDNREWKVHPYNPRNNVNYTAEESGLAKEINYYSGAQPSRHAFFHTVPAMDDNVVVRWYQDAFVNRLLDFSLKYPNVLYCMNSEIREDPEWGRHWARFIRRRARAEGVDVYLADMRRNSNFNSAEQIELLLYINGEEVAAGTIGGDLSPWSANLRLALGDEFVGDRGWLGVYHGAAIYSRALNAAEIADHHAAGAPEHVGGLQARYAFDAGEGSVIRDATGLNPALDLHIQNAAAVTWRDDGLRTDRPVLIATQAPAGRLTAAVRESNAFTLEAWITPAQEVQTGPARIVTLSQDHVTRNFTLGQEDQTYEMRVRTTATLANGLPSLHTPRDVEASVAAARGLDGQSAVIFVTHGGLLEVDLDRLQPGLTAAWFNPLSAERRPAAPRPDGRFQPPTHHDWVLVLH